MFVRFITSVALLLAAPLIASARPVVVELFTSEGCSSCPPADAYLSELSHSRPELLPLAFHVTYWNSLGWRDPFSLDAATERQAEYGARFADGSYTPEMVVDGRKGLVGSDRGAAEAAIRTAQNIDGTGVDVTGVRHAGTISIRVGSGVGSGQVLLVGYDAEHVTAVGRGENSGRTLRESNIVRSIRPIAEWVGPPLTLELAVPAGDRAAVLIQSRDGSIIGAARITEGPL